jgi:hypothetical protein
MTIFGLSLFQVFLLVLVVALAIIVAEQIRKHGLDPFLASVKAGATKAEVNALAEGKLLLADFEALLHHAKTTAATLPPGSTVDASSGKNTISITTPIPDPVADTPQPLPIDPIQAVKRYIAGGMTPAQGMPNAYELQWLFSLAKAAQYAWGVAVAAAFDAQLSPATAGTNVLIATVGDIGGPPPCPPGIGIRVEAQTYLEMVGGGYPIIGTCNWTKS